MSKIFINIIFFSLLLIIILTKDEKDKADDKIDKYKKEFESSVVTYLTDNFLYKNEVVIVDKKAFKSIFRDIMNTEGAKVFKVFQKIFNKVVDEFIKDAYPKGKKNIKATQLHKIFEYEYVMEKFNTYVSKNNIKEEDL